MNKAMYAAASGMSAEQQKLDLIAGNLSNADDVGFKSSVMEFAELANGRDALGSTAIGSHVLFTQGKLMQSGGPFDLAIDGNGFFVVHRRDGTTAYTRDGHFARAPDGSLRNDDGAQLAGVTIPKEAVNVSVDRAGKVFADTDSAKHVAIGHVKLAVFDAPEALRSLGGTIFEATRASGSPRVVVAGSHGSGAVAFGMLEKSNVSIMEAMMEILNAQRAFEANAKGAQAADEMQRIANNINRG
ncbi:MAG: flagellar hook-basal body protein [Vulcanimicrobiaceae bacterium]